MIKLSQIRHKRSDGKTGFMLPGSRFTPNALEALEVLNEVESIASQLTMSRATRVAISKVYTNDGALLVRRESHNKRLFLGV